MGPSDESLALADFLISKLGLQIDRINLAYAIMDHVEVDYAEELRYEDEISDLRSALAAKSAEVEGLRRGWSEVKHSIQQANVPGNDWKRELKLISNIVDAAMEKSNEHQDQ